MNLIGDCQGGWLATIFAALHPERVKTLTIAGAPIDFHAGEPVIHAALRSLAPGVTSPSIEDSWRPAVGYCAASTCWPGSSRSSPIPRSPARCSYWPDVNDPAHVERYREFEDWFKHTQAIPGAFYLWIVEHLFRDNELIAGKLEIGGQRVTLDRIECPLNLLAGATDHITPPDQVFALADYASTPPEDIVRDTTTGGHLGLFMGREALSDHWPPLLAAVRGRCRASLIWRSSPDP